MTYLMNGVNINTQFKHIKITNIITINLTPLNLSILGSKDLDFLSSFKLPKKVCKVSHKCYTCTFITIVHHCNWY